MKVYIKQNGFLNNQEITEAKAVELLEDGFRELTLDDKYHDCCFLDFDSNLMFDEQKYRDRKFREKKKFYEIKVAQIVRNRYSLDEELSILRKRDSNPNEFNEYFAFVEDAKIQVKNEIGGDFEV